MRDQTAPPPPLPPEAEPRLEAGGPAGLEQGLLLHPKVPVPGGAAQAHPLLPAPPSSRPILRFHEG